MLINTQSVIFVVVIFALSGRGVTSTDTITDNFKNANDKKLEAVTELCVSGIERFETMSRKYTHIEDELFRVKTKNTQIEDELSRVKAKNEEMEYVLRRMMTGKEIQRESRLVLNDGEKRAAFYVERTLDLANVGHQQTIIFNKVITNIGGGYNIADGIFTATFPGTYVFSWTTQNTDGTHMKSELVVNNVVKGTTWSDAYNHADNAVASITAVVELAAGDIVLVRAFTTNNPAVTLQGRLPSTFSGWLLYD